MLKRKTIIIEKNNVEKFSKNIDTCIEDTIINSYNFKHNIFEKIKVFDTISYLSLIQEDLMCYNDNTKIYNDDESYEVSYKNNFEKNLIESLI